MNQVNEINEASRSGRVSRFLVCVCPSEVAIRVPSQTSPSSNLLLTSLAFPSGARLYLPKDGEVIDGVQVSPTRMQRDGGYTVQ